MFYYNVSRRKEEEKDEFDSSDVSETLKELIKKYDEVVEYLGGLEFESELYFTLSIFKKEEEATLLVEGVQEDEIEKFEEVLRDLAFKDKIIGFLRIGNSKIVVKVGK